MAVLALGTDVWVAILVGGEDRRLGGVVQPGNRFVSFVRAMRSCV